MTDPNAFPGRRIAEARKLQRAKRLADPAYLALLRERLVHRLPIFLPSTETPACGQPEPQISDPETQAIHRVEPMFPQDAIRFCEQLGGP